MAFFIYKDVPYIPAHFHFPYIYISNHIHVISRQNEQPLYLHVFHSVPYKNSRYVTLTGAQSIITDGQHTLMRFFCYI